MVGDLFEHYELGTVEVKGIAGPVPAWRVLRPSVVASRFEAHSCGGYRDSIVVCKKMLRLLDYGAPNPGVDLSSRLKE